MHGDVAVRLVTDAPRGEKAVAEKEHPRNSADARMDCAAALLPRTMEPSPVLSTLAFSEASLKERVCGSFFSHKKEPQKKKHNAMIRWNGTAGA